MSIVIFSIPFLSIDANDAQHSDGYSSGPWKDTKNPGGEILDSFPGGCREVGTDESPGEAVHYLSLRKITDAN